MCERERLPGSIGKEMRFSCAQAFFGPVLISTAVPGRAAPWIADWLDRTNVIPGHLLLLPRATAVLLAGAVFSLGTGHPLLNWTPSQLSLGL